VAGATPKESRRKKRNADTNAFLTSLNGGALTLANAWLRCDKRTKLTGHSLPQRWASRANTCHGEM
jgi:hypothetical protein